MGTVKNVEMNYFNGADYDVIRPEIVLENVGDFNSYMGNNYYTQNEVNNKINEAVSIPTGWESLGTFNGWTGNTTENNFSSANTTDTSIIPSINYMYWIVINFEASLTSVWSYDIQVDLDFGTNTNTVRCYSINQESSERGQFKWNYKGIWSFIPGKSLSSNWDLYGLSGYNGTEIDKPFIGIASSNTFIYRPRIVYSNPSGSYGAGFSVRANNVSIYRSKINLIT